MRKIPPSSRGRVRKFPVFRSGAPYGRHGPRKAGGSGTRPFSIFGAIPIDAPPICTLYHGWSELGAAGKSHRPKFCTAPGPSGPEGIIPGTVFCAPEILRKGIIGVSHVNGGPGVERLWAGTPIGAHPRRRFASFAAAGKGGRPAGRNPVRRRAGSPRPTGIMVRGGRAGLGPAPTAIHGHSRDMAGGASPSPTDGWGNIPRQRIGRRPQGLPLRRLIFLLTQPPFLPIIRSTLHMKEASLFSQEGGRP